MPRRRTRKLIRRRQRGGSFMSFLKRVGKFFKRTKLISRAGRLAGMLGVPYVGTIGRAAGAVGLGRRRRYRRRKTRRGGSLKLAGQGLNPTGGSIRYSRRRSVRSLRPLPMHY